MQFVLFRVAIVVEGSNKMESPAAVDNSVSLSFDDDEALLNVNPSYSSTPIQHIIANNKRKKEFVRDVQDSDNEDDSSSANCMLPSSIKTTVVTENVGKKKKKATRRNYTDDGKVDKKKKREGRDLADTFYYNVKSLMALAEKLHNTTGAAVFLTIKPLTNRGTTKTFKTDNFDEKNCAGSRK